MTPRSNTGRSSWRLAALKCRCRLCAGQLPAAQVARKLLMLSLLPFFKLDRALFACRIIIDAIIALGPPLVDTLIRQYFAATSAGGRINLRFAGLPEPRGPADAL